MPYTYLWRMYTYWMKCFSKDDSVINLCYISAINSRTADNRQLVWYHWWIIPSLIRLITLHTYIRMSLWHGHLCLSKDALMNYDKCVTTTRITTTTTTTIRESFFERFLVESTSQCCERFWAACRAGNCNCGDADCARSTRPLSVACYNFFLLAQYN